MRSTGQGARNCHGTNIIVELRPAGVRSEVVLLPGKPTILLRFHHFFSGDVFSVGFYDELSDHVESLFESVP